MSDIPRDHTQNYIQAMTTQKPSSKPSPANDDYIVDAKFRRRVHPVFEIYESSLPCRIRQDAWWLAE